MLPQGQGHQNPPLEVVVVEGPSGGRFELDPKLVIAPNTHLQNIVTAVDIAYSAASLSDSESASNEAPGRPVGGSRNRIYGAKPSRGASWTIIAAVGNSITQ